MPTAYVEEYHSAGSNVDLVHQWSTYADGVEEILDKLLLKESEEQEIEAIAVSTTRIAAHRVLMTFFSPGYTDETGHRHEFKEYKIYHVEVEF